MNVPQFANPTNVLEGLLRSLPDDRRARLDARLSGPPTLPSAEQHREMLRVATQRQTQREQQREPQREPRPGNPIGRILLFDVARNAVSLVPPPEEIMAAVAVEVARFDRISSAMDAAAPRRTVIGDFRFFGSGFTAVPPALPEDIDRRELRFRNLPWHTCREENNDKECPICQEGHKKGEEIVTLLCNHTLHRECAWQWLKRLDEQTGRYNDTCPLCRFDTMGAPST